MSQDSLKQTQTVDQFFKSSIKKDLDGTMKKEIEINGVDTANFNNEDTERGLIQVSTEKEGGSKSSSVAPTFGNKSSDLVRKGSQEGGDSIHGRDPINLSVNHQNNLSVNQNDVSKHSSRANNSVQQLEADEAEPDPTMANIGYI